MSDKNIHQKKKLISQLQQWQGIKFKKIKQRIMLTEIPEDKYIRYMRSHKSGNIHVENGHIWAVQRKKLFLEN